MQLLVGETWKPRKHKIKEFPNFTLNADVPIPSNGILARRAVPRWTRPISNFSAQELKDNQSTCAQSKNPKAMKANVFPMSCHVE